MALTTRFRNEQENGQLKTGNTDASTCESCFQSKVKRKGIADTNPFKRMWADIDKIQKGNRCRCIDDYSRFTFARLLKLKSKVSNVIKDNAAVMAIKDCRQTVQYVDNRKEYLSKNSKVFWLKRNHGAYFRFLRKNNDVYFTRRGTCRRRRSSSCKVQSRCRLKSWRSHWPEVNSKDLQRGYDYVGPITQKQEGVLDVGASTMFGQRSNDGGGQLVCNFKYQK